MTDKVAVANRKSRGIGNPVRVLLVNKFLFPNGGTETYTLKLGEYLISQGHEVQYFGMEHENRIVGNKANSYTSYMDFHDGNILSKATYPIRVIYSVEARKKIRKVLDSFKPDVVHLNLFNYQLTPSIILEVVKWRKMTKRACRIIYTSHDYQLLCPNHMLFNPKTRKLCEKCIGGKYINCINNKCIHGSRAKSLVGTAEAMYWKTRFVYKYIDTIICCSEFMKSKMDLNPFFKEKTVALLNFVDDYDLNIEKNLDEKKNYVIYFGRYSSEKGLGTLVKACKRLPDISFIFVGGGPLESKLNEKIKNIPNIENVGFKSGKELETLIREARFSVCPSEWYENCPFSVIESIMYGTPVLGTRIGGIPELIQEGVTGELFTPGDTRELIEKIRNLWNHHEVTDLYSSNCGNDKFDNLGNYCNKLLKIYEGKNV